eukprot:scaffold4776_cov87-Isochrysis_galbana.AAC.1
MKKVPPAPRSFGKREKTLAGVRVTTVLSSHSRHEMTSMPPRLAAAQSSGAARASWGDPDTTDRMPLAPRASTQPSSSSTLCSTPRLPHPPALYPKEVTRPSGPSRNWVTRLPPSTRSAGSGSPSSSADGSWARFSLAASGWMMSS